MTDILSLDSGYDSGGESIQLLGLTKEEQDVADAQDFNSLKAYGAGKDDMVTFLQVGSNALACFLLDREFK